METLIERWGCRRCGRDKFPRPYMPHRCGMMFLKHYRKKVWAEAFPQGMFKKVTQPYWGA